MESDRRLSLAVGAFVLASLVGLAIAVLSLTNEKGFWTPQYRLFAYYNDAQGLISGAPVWLAGKDVGIVESVTFSPLGGDRPSVQVTLQLNRDVQDRIRADSVASIGTIGLLGDKYIEIRMGTLEAQPLTPDSEIRTVDPVNLTDVVERGALAIDNLSELAVNINRVVKDFGDEMGGTNLASALGAISGIVQEVETGDGLLHNLIYEPGGKEIQEIDASLARINAASQRLNQILVKIDEGQGTLGLLVNDPNLYHDLRTVIEDTQGMLGRARKNRLIRSLIQFSSEKKEEPPVDLKSTPEKAK